MDHFDRHHYYYSPQMSPTLEDNAQGFPPVSTQFSTTSKDVLNVYETEVASSPNYTPKQRFINQSYALAKKNFIILSRSWGWTFVRAFLIPVIVAVYIGKMKVLFFPSANYGIGAANQSIMPLRDAVEEMKLVYYSHDYGLASAGDIESIMSAAFQGIPSAQIELATSADSLSVICPQSLRGVSPCYGAVQWNAIDTQEGIYNYTIRGNSGFSKIDILKNRVDIDRYILPLQLAIDDAIRNTTTHLSSIPFTSLSAEENEKDQDRQFLDMLRDWISPFTYIAFIGVVYHLAGVVAQERELGLTQLLNSMGTTHYARLGGFCSSFGAVYLPSWIAVGVLTGLFYFKHSSIIISILFCLFNGAASVTWAIFLGTLFKKAQLAGIISAGASIVLAIMTAVQVQAGGGSDSPTAIYICSFIFNPMSFSFFIQMMCSNESDYVGVNLFKQVNNGKTYPIVLLIAPIFQIFFYLALTLLAEQVLYGKLRAPPTNANSGNAIEIQDLCKTYKGRDFFCFGRQKIVKAVENLSLKIAPNQIYSLLGANGSGKTTTLEMISGIQKSTSGSITFGRDSKIGICPQKNVLWENLTVAEHINIWSQLKGVPKTSIKQATNYFIEKCDLPGKEKTFSQNLSGGQQRKLQLAIMFTGGSNVCCIDEVSSGIDPVSRRVIWDILMAFRDTHTMILTTHFLDEADILSDNIAVLSKGVLQAEGSPIELKESLGDGYRVFIDRSGSGHEESYSFANPQEVLGYITELEANRVPYRVAGPELEDVFLKLAGKDHEGYSLDAIDFNDKSKKDLEQNRMNIQSRRVGFLTQLRAVFLKRLIVLLRGPFPEIAFMALPSIVAGACQSFMKKAPSQIECSLASRVAAQKYVLPSNFDVSLNIPFASAQDFAAASAGFKTFVDGQASWISTSSSAASAFSSNITNALNFVGSFDDLYKYIQSNYSTVAPGGISLINNPTVSYQADADNAAEYSTFIMNLFSNLAGNGTQTIVTNYSKFETSWTASTTNSLKFVVFLGFAMGIAPAFTALYPTFERLSKVRAMQYSNGLRVLPMWTAYILFYLPIILITCDITLAIMATKLGSVYGAGHMYLCFFMFYVDAILISFIASLFVKSQLAAFATIAGYQAIGVLAYLMGYLSIQAFGDPLTMDSTIRLIYFIMAVFWPVQSLMRALFMATNAFSILCGTNDTVLSMGDILAYGAPILYLFMQFFILFGFLIWWESGSRLIGGSKSSAGIWKRFRGLFRTKWAEIQDEQELEFSTPLEVQEEKREIDQNLEKFSDGLAIQNVRREFGGKYVVDGISFGVVPGECFALLGPNGAGKTTTFNMIRGEVPTSSGDIFVTGVSVFQNRALARTKLGVCPQFDAMDKMTVFEVLQFYARLRGIDGPKGMVKEHIDKLIHDVDLVRFRSRMASALSGGNKRKLSLAVALIGNPEVLLLDEPSSGMDAFAKRIMWRTLAESAPNRSIVLTTHSMEEADALANRAGILARKMLALGTVDSLRNKYGNVIHAQLVCGNAPATTINEMNAVVGMVVSLFPGAKVEDRMYQGQIKVAIPTAQASTEHYSSYASSSAGAGPSSSTDHTAFTTAASVRPGQATSSVATIFRILEENKQSMGLKSYSVYPTRLEEVFLKLVGDYVEKNEQ